MTLAVLSPCLLNVNPNLTKNEEFYHYSKISKLINNIYMLTDLKFQYYRNAPYDGYKMEIPEYKENLTLNNLVSTNIFGKIQKMMSKDYVDLNGIPPAIPPPIFVLPNNGVSDTFCRYINYIKDKDGILFIGCDNFDVPKPIEFYSDCYFKIKTSTYIEIEQTDVLYPYLKKENDNNVIFPQSTFCLEYNNFVINQKQLNGFEKIALFERIGKIVATYNGYEKEQRLTRMNSTKNKLRTVYKKRNGKTYYLSIDVESGGFEVFDCKFDHLGQYNFSCVLVKPPSPKDHKLNH